MRYTTTSILSAVTAAMLLFTLILFTPLRSSSAQTVRICNGSGNECIATYNDSGVEYTVESESETEGGDLVIEFQE
jgi:hypothetical protein